MKVYTPMLEEFINNLVIWGDAQFIALGDSAVDSIVTDPPYGLSFMGKAWDHGIPGKEFWVEALRVTKPGGHMLAFGGTRTYHRLTCAIEDAGWEIRDCLMWIYGSGFPKSLDIGKAMDKEAGAKREMVGPSQHHSPGRKPTNTLRSLNKLYNKEDDGKYITAPSTDLAKAWDGWGTGLKPAWEPIILARKPIDKGLTIAKNVAKWGTGGINIGACRVGTEILKEAPHEATPERVGRFPANLIHDGSDEVLAGFPITGGPKAGRVGKRGGSNAMHMSRESGDNEHQKSEGTWPADTGGSAARFFYCAKCSRTDRDGSNHPCMKPTKLLQYLCRLITPPNGLVLDPFCGSGSTGKACTREGFQFIGIEKEAEYCKIAKLRVS